MAISLEEKGNALSSRFTVMRKLPLQEKAPGRIFLAVSSIAAMSFSVLCASANPVMPLVVASAFSTSSFGALSSIYA